MADLLSLPAELRQRILEYALYPDPSGALAVTVIPGQSRGDLRLSRKNGSPTLSDLSFRKGFPLPAAYVCRSLRADALDIWGRHTMITINFPVDAADESFVSNFIDECDALVPHCRAWNVWSAVVWFKGYRTWLQDEPKQKCQWSVRTRNNLLLAEYRDKVLTTKDFDLEKLAAMVEERTTALLQGGQREGFTAEEIRELYYGPMRALGMNTSNWRAASEPATRFWAFGSCRKDTAVA